MLKKTHATTFFTLPKLISKNQREIIEYAIVAYGFLLNTSKWRNREVSYCTFADIIAATHDMGCAYNRESVRVLKSLLTPQQFDLFEVREGDIAYRIEEEDGTHYLAGFWDFDSPHELSSQDYQRYEELGKILCQL